MKKIYLTIGLAAASLLAQGQRRDSLYQKRPLFCTEVQALLSYYTQDGRHSAVTGGIGTENLQVFAPQLFVKHTLDSNRTIRFDGGFDVITSASTDRIDYVMSSASRRDVRSHANVGYSRLYRKPALTLSGGGGFSVESDYFSVGGEVATSYQNAAQSREISGSFSAYFDDLRWGRLDPKQFRPAKLIYPVELQSKEWFDTFRRNSYNLAFAINQVINARTTLGIYPGISFQTGALATPFHRVYFADSTLKVEKLPSNRLKIPLGFQLNTFLGSRVVLRSYYRFYWDSFGIQAHTFSVETSVKLTPIFTLSPFVRLYTQTAANSFEPYREHRASDPFYTSDYDLSRFSTYKIGMGIRYAPFQKLTKKLDFEAVTVRYSFYARSDGLAAHSLSLLWELAGGKPRKGSYNNR